MKTGKVILISFITTVATLVGYVAAMRLWEVCKKKKGKDIPETSDDIIEV